MDINNLKTQDRVDSGKLDKDFAKRLAKGTNGDLLTEGEDKAQGKKKVKQSTFPQDSMLATDELDGSWLLLDGKATKANAVTNPMEISPPREVSASRKTSASKSARPSSGRVSEADSDRSSGSRKPSKIPRVASLSSSKAASGALQSNDSGKEDKVSSAKKADAKPRMAFGRRVDSPTSSQKSSGSTTARGRASADSASGKSATGKAELPSKASDKPSFTLAVPEAGNSKGSAAFRASKKGATLTKQLPSGSVSQRTTAKTSTPVSRLASSAKQSLPQQSTTPRNNGLLRAVSGSESESEPQTERASPVQSTPGQPALTQDATAATPQIPPPIPAGEEVPVYVLPPLQDELVAHPIAASPATTASTFSRPQSASLTLEPALPKPDSTPARTHQQEGAHAEIARLQSHALAVSDDESSVYSNSRPSSPANVKEVSSPSPSQTAQLPVSTAAASAHPDNVEVDLESKASLPMWPAPGLPSPGANPIPSSTGPAPAAAAGGPVSSTAEQNASPGSQPAEKVDQKVSPVSQTESGTPVEGAKEPVPARSAFEEVNVSASQTRDAPDSNPQQGGVSVDDLSVSKPSGEMPPSPFTQTASGQIEAEKPESRPGIGSKSKKESRIKGSAESPQQNKKKSTTCCGCTIM